MVCLYCLPLGSTSDKRNGSSFAHLVQFLRACTGRTDPMSPSQLSRFDMSVLRLYVPGDYDNFVHGARPTKAKPRPAPKRFLYEDPFSRGAVRYFYVEQNPPKYGRPVVQSTHTLESMIDTAVSRWTGDAVAIDWAEAEREHAGEAPPTAGDSTLIPDE